MKCEKCNENESNFFYRSTVNGEVTESRLCTDCAREAGLLQPVSIGHDMFADLFTAPFPAPFPASLPAALAAGPFGSFCPGARLFPIFETMRFPAPARPDKTAAEPGAGSIPADAGEDIRKKRELCALRHQLRAAVRDENYEKAIELRDTIKARET